MQKARVDQSRHLPPEFSPSEALTWGLQSPADPPMVSIHVDVCVNPDELEFFFKRKSHIMQTHERKVFISLTSTNFTNQEFCQQGYKQMSSLTMYF